MIIYGLQLVQLIMVINANQLKKAVFVTVGLECSVSKRVAPLQIRFEAHWLRHFPEGNGRDVMLSEVKIGR